MVFLFSKHMKSYSSKDNYTNKASSEMHTGSRVFFFFFHIPPYTYTALPPCNRPPESLGLLTGGATIYQNSASFSLGAGTGHARVAYSLVDGLWRCDIFYTTQYVAICQTFTLQTAKTVRATSAYRSPRHPEESRDVKSILSLCGYSSQ